MKCTNCGFNNLGVEYIEVVALDEDEELNCEFCGTDLRQDIIDFQTKE